MYIKYFGHSCFLVESGSTRILLDPCDPETGYTLPEISADAVTVSHGHHDHSYTAAAPGAKIISEPGKTTVGDFTVEGFPCCHDGEKGALRGGNIMYMLEAEGIRLLHCGDLGHTLTPAEVEALGGVDVLMLPVGGVYTIGPEQAIALAFAIDPKVLIPMHYSTEALSFRLGGLKDFLDMVSGHAIHRMRQSEVMLGADTLGDHRVVVLDHARPQA